MTKEEYEGLLARSLDSFSDRTYENLMDEILDRISAVYDKRDGSMIYNAIAARTFEEAMQYGALDFVLSQTFIYTATREFLIRRASDRSIKPKEATYSIHYADFDRAQPVPAGTRFSCEDLNFVVIPFPDGDLRKEITLTIDGAEDSRDRQLVQCETAGTIGNTYGGDLIPIDYVDGLTKAVLISPDVELYEDAVDEEETEAFRARAIEAMRSIAFGGNIADYKERVLALNGIGQVKVHTVWNATDGVTPALLRNTSGISAAETVVNGLSDSTGKTYLLALLGAAAQGKLTLGGAVRLVVAGTDMANPTLSTQKLNDVSDLIDPPEHAGEGYGLAPIGHVVHVECVETVGVNVAMTVNLRGTATTSQVQTAVAPVLAKYWKSLVEKWSSTGDEGVSILSSIIVHDILDDETCASLIVSVDHFYITIGSTTSSDFANVSLGADQVPVAGTVTVTATA